MKKLTIIPMEKTFIKTILILIIISAASCDNVENGYRIDYMETPAQFIVSLLSSNRAAISDTVSFSIKVSSDYDIKSIVSVSTVSGGEGTGYFIDSAAVDPFVDHAFGTVQPGTREMDFIYYYVADQDTVDAKITFSLIDDYGKKSVSFDLIMVPSVVKYDSVVLYTNTSAYTDGFSTFDGTVYFDLSNYEDLTVANESVQESLDIIFLANASSSKLVAPYSGYFTSSMSVRNKTLFKIITGISNEEFDKLTNASLSEITELYEVKKGSTDIQDIRVGDIIGFKTDFASANPYHYGLLRINAIHPANVDHYAGTSYLIEMDVVTQK